MKEPISTRHITEARKLAEIASPPHPKPGLERRFYSMHLRRDAAEIFAFLADPKNLEVLAPPERKLRVRDPKPGDKGAHFDLLVLGIRVRWRTGITRSAAPFGFTEEQISGPFSIWRHTTTFTDEGDRVRLDDEVVFRAAYWPIGELFAPKIRHALDRAFAHRGARLAEIFDTP